MKTLALLATTTLLAAVVIMPVSAEPCNNVTTQSAVVQPERVKSQGIHLFHAKKIAFKQEASDGSQPAETVKPVKDNLDYSTDSFIIN